MKRVLIVEDDPHIVELLSIHLTDLECTIECAYDGLSGLNNALNNSFDLIILDWMLPKLDGLEVCKKVRAKENHTPILMLTAKSEEIDKVLGLETGADDYLTKPFSIREFIARVKAIFRRSKLNSIEVSKEEEEEEEKVKILKFLSLEINVHKRKVTLEDKRVELTPKEFELLTLLASRPGRSYSREEILNLVWGYEFSGYDHTVNSHINRLRSKIENNLAKPQYILTTWGIGYRFNDELAN